MNSSPTEVESQIIENFGIPEDEIVKISAKSGKGMSDFNKELE